jgi:hypothetical protein
LSNALAAPPASTSLTEKQLMPPPTFSPRRNVAGVNKMNSPGKALSPPNIKLVSVVGHEKSATPNKAHPPLSSHSEKVFEKIRQFIVAVQSKRLLSKIVTLLQNTRTSQVAAMPL